MHPKFFCILQEEIIQRYLNHHIIFYNCTINKNIKCPYLLDGIIFTGLEQKYTSDKKLWKYQMYKYKPPDKNSIDVYVKFPRNRDTGGYLDVFDNSLQNMVDGKIYRIVNLYVGDSYKNNEIPVPFMKEQNNHVAYFPLIRGEVRDIEGIWYKMRLLLN